MSGTIDPQVLQQAMMLAGTQGMGQTQGLLGLPMSIPQGTMIPQGQVQANNAGLGQLYNAVSQYALNGQDPGLPHPFLGQLAPSMYPDWSPMHQLAGIAASRSAQSDQAAINALLNPQPTGPPPLTDEELARLNARTGNEAGGNDNSGGTDSSY
jgi:hypothetical protein